MIGPGKKKLYPNENIKTVYYISNLSKRPNIEIGYYTCYSDNKKSTEKFYDNIEHHYEFLGDKLIKGRTHEVGKKDPNNWGLYDMIGNIWE